MEIDFSDINGLSLRLIKASADYKKHAIAAAEAKRSFELHNAMTKSVLAANFMSAKAKTAAEKERIALCSDEYEGHLAEVEERRGKYLALKATFESIKVYHDSLRAILSAQQSLIKIQ